MTWSVKHSVISLFLSLSHSLSRFSDLTSTSLLFSSLPISPPLPILHTDVTRSQFGDGLSGRLYRNDLNTFCTV